MSPSPLFADLPAPAAGGASLAVRYRPRRFAEVVGQRHVTSVLRRAIATSRLPQQLLFSGGSGLGKTTLARVTAAALLCSTPLDQREDGDACGVCEDCLDITTPGRTHPDVVEFDAASHGGKDEIKTIADRAQLSPMRAHRKVYIIDEAHGLSGPGGQAFLKLLEEPPAHVTFMLATTDPQKMLKTNRGRCTEFELLPPTFDQLTANVLRVASGEGWVLGTAGAQAVVEASDAALGVRATLMGLEKLAGALDEGDVLDAPEVTALLGSSSPATLAALLDAIEAFDPVRAFAALESARRVSSEGAIRTTLIDWARAGLLATTPETFDADRWRLAQVLDAPQSPGWLELVIARLVSPTPTSDSLAALSSLASEQIEHLRSLLAAVEKLYDDPSVMTPDEPAQDSLTPPPAEVEPHDAASFIEAFVDAVAAVAPKAAAILRDCELTSPDPLVLVIRPSAANVSALKAQAEPVRQVAADMGITLRNARPVA